MRLAVTAAGISGMAAACMNKLTPEQIIQTASSAGFPPDVATEMTAVALRESAGCATAHNPGPGEDSYGLWQINVQGNPGIMRQLGITDPSQLLDPSVNAKAAYLIWGGNPANLDVAWYINRPGYSQAYQSYLPVAQQAAINAGLDTSSSLPDASVPGVMDVNVNPASGDVNWPLVGLIAAAALLAMAAIGD